MVNAAFFLGFTLCASAPTASELRALIPRDPPPKELTRGLHYVRSDEARHDLFRSRITELGGVFLGVGTNQNYLMAAWSRPELLIILDFDEVVVHIHDAYRAFFLHAKTPEAFLRLWRPRPVNRRRAFALINRTFKARKRRLNARRAVMRFGKRVYRGLWTMRREMNRHNVPCFLKDKRQYRFLREMVADDRVLVTRGDFTGPRTIRGIAEALKKSDETISVLYLSNVEQYIGWGSKFRQNLLTLPLADDGVVLRTYGWGHRRTADHNYRYYVQPAELFERWLEESERTTRYVRHFLETEEPSAIVGYHELTVSPDGRHQGFR